MRMNISPLVLRGSRFLSLRGVGLLALMGLALAQSLVPAPRPETPGALSRCQEVFSGLKPLFLYAERLAPERFLIRGVLGNGGLPLTRITLSGNFTPVPLGLEDLAVQAVRPALDRGRLLDQAARLFDGVGQGISLGNWYTQEVRAYRCYLTYQGRVVGVFRLDLNLQPISEPKLLQAYRRAPLRYPAFEPSSAPQ